MPVITGTDTVKKVKISDVYFVYAKTKNGKKLVAKIKCTHTDNEGNETHGIVSIFLTPDILKYDMAGFKAGTTTEIEAGLALMESHGLTGGNPKNIVDMIGVETGLYVKDKGEGKYAYYLQHVEDVLDIDEATNLITQIRGKAKQNLEGVQGTPVEESDPFGGDNLKF